MGFISRWYSFLGLDILMGGKGGSSTPSMPHSGKQAVDPATYWQGRDHTFAHEWTQEVRTNAQELLRRVNLLLADLNVASAKVVSGWRPREVNASIGGAPNSHHIFGRAVDLRDNSNQEFARLIMNNNHLLHKYQLWMEDPRSTKGKNSNWVHLDIGNRPDRDLRVFDL